MNLNQALRNNSVPPAEVEKHKERISETKTQFENMVTLLALKEIHSSPDVSGEEDDFEKRYFLLKQICDECG